MNENNIYNINDEVLEVDEYGLLEGMDYRKYSIRWFSWPIILALLVTLAMILVRAWAHMGTVLLAYLNCVIGTWAVMKFAKKGTLEALVPVLFLPLLIVAWPFASIYFAVFCPDVSYATII